MVGAGWINVPAWAMRRIDALASRRRTEGPGTHLATGEMGRLGDAVFIGGDWHVQETEEREVVGRSHLIGCEGSGCVLLK
jgi:hypothetical protein